MARQGPGVVSFETGLRVLEAFDRESPRLTLGELAARCGITRYAARRYMNSLMGLGYATSDGKRYFLTPRVLRAGSVYLSDSPILAKLQPLLHQLTAEIEESTYLSVIDGDKTLVIAKATVNRITNRSHSLGAHFPLFVTSAGLAISASLPSAELDGLLARYRPLAFTGGTLMNPKDILAEVALTRNRGFAVSERQLDDLVRGIAVPLRDMQGNLVGAISANMFIGNESAEASVLRVLGGLRRTAELASAQL